MVNFVLEIKTDITVKNILTRALSGSIYVALVVMALLLHSHYMFTCLFMLIAAIGIMELHRLIDDKNSGKRYKLISAMLDAAGGVSLFATIHAIYAADFTKYVPIALLVYLSCIIIRMIMQLYSKSANPLQSFAYSSLTQIYVALPLALLNIPYIKYGGHTVLAIFIMIWLNDTGAYCVGSMFGRHRLFERISPKKSWEGFWGGMAFCIIAGILFSEFGKGLFGELSLAQWIILGVIVSAFSTWGDLIESQLKRTLNVKDSGHLIPGHGGILDRIDSLLLVSPTIVIYFTLIEFLQ